MKENRFNPITPPPPNLKTVFLGEPWLRNFFNFINEHFFQILILMHRDADQCLKIIKNSP